MNLDSINVLLVDDKIENIYSLESLLEGDRNINFLHALSGNEALKMSLKYDLALILLDVQMPGMDGYEVANILKSNKATENIPIIFVTALDQAASLLEGYNTGAIDYLLKPLHPTITKVKVKAFIKMHEQLKLSESLATLVNNCQDLMCIIDIENFRILNCNEAWLDVLGHEMAAVQNSTFYSWFLEDDNLIELKDFLLKKIGSKANKVQTELKILSVTNKAHWFFWNFTCKEGRWYASGKDITLRKEAETALNNAHLELNEAHKSLISLNEVLEEKVLERTKELNISKERFDAVARATNDTLWDWNLLTNEFWWSGGYKTYYGYEQDDTFNIESKFANIHPDDAPSIKDDIQKLLKSGKNNWSREYRFIKASGTYASILDRAFVLYDSTNQPTRIIGSMFDLSEIKKVQMQLNSINLELSNKNEELSRINRDMDTFIYTTSHDLKAPVSNIEGLISTLDDIIISEAKNETYQSIVDMIRLSIEKFKTTLKDLSEIAKADSEDHSDVEETFFEEMLDEVKINIQSLISDSQAIINTNFKDVPAVNFSRKNLRSVFYNLVSNGIKYKAENRKPIINISTQRVDEALILLTVQDNGLGIRGEDKEKVFKMFKRLHNHVEGTGVGMSIVKRIVDNSGGRIELESEVGVGSVFKIYLRG